MKNYLRLHKFLYILILILVLLLIFGGWFMINKQEKLHQEIQLGNKMIVEMDVTTKELDGQYTKLVDYFNTEKELNQLLKNENKKLYQLIKKQNETITMVNNSVLSLKSMVSEGFGEVNVQDTNLIDLTLKYPSESDNFISWDGYVNRNNAFYSGEWKFGRLPLQIILTETERGMWRSRLIGPDWLVVDSMEINSLPIPKLEEEGGFGLVLGGGYVRSFNPNNNNGISIGAGLRFKRHTLMINGTTNQEVGFNYYYNIFNFRKK